MTVNDQTGVLCFNAVCEECGICGSSHKIENCSFINPNLDIVKDTETQPYAQITLPRGLEVKNFTGRKSVFAKDPFPKGVQFGPFIAKTSDLLDVRIDFPLKVFLNDDTSVYLETYEDLFANWMCYVNAAKFNEEQNLICYQNNGSIYFCSIKDINAGEELKVGYSPHYAKKMRYKQSLIFDEGSQKSDDSVDIEIQTTKPKMKKRELNNLSIIEKNYQRSILRTRKLPGGEIPNKWDCKECGEVDMTVEVFAKHLMNHIKKNHISSYTCPFCSKKFRKDGYNRKMHLSTCKWNPDKTQKENSVSNKFFHAELMETEKISNETKSTYELDHQGWNADIVRDNIIDSGALGDNVVKSQINTPILDLGDDIDFNKINAECSAEKNIFESELNKSTDFDFVFSSEISSQIPNDDGAFFGEAHSFLNANFPSSIEVTDQEKEDMLNIFFQDTQEMGGVESDITVENSNSNMNYEKENEINTMKDNQNTATMKCEICQKRFGKELNLYRHLRKHTGEFKCKTCGKVFGRNENLKQHMKTCKIENFSDHHSQNSVPWYKGTNKGQGKKKQILCHICGVISRSHSSARLHKLIHGEKLFVCSECDKKFCRKDMLQQHMLVHKEYEWECNICLKKFSRMKSLQNHQKDCQSIIQTCLYCDKSFKAKSSLKRHMKKHLSTVACIYCKKEFNDDETLNKHTAEEHSNIVMFIL